MRVLFVSPAAGLGGSERSLLDCIFALREADPTGDARLLAFADGPLVHRARELGASVEVIVPPRELATLGESARDAARLDSVWAAFPAMRFLVELKRAIVRAAPDVVHTNGMKAHLLAGCVTPSDVRLIVHLRDFIGSRRASRRLLPLLAKLRARTVFVANSHAVAEDFLRIAPRAAVHTVYNVVDTDHFAPGPSEPEWLASLAGLESPSRGGVSFGLVATYARWKGHHLFIEAAGHLRAAHPNLSLRFYVVGGPIYETAGSQVDAAQLSEFARKAGIADCFGLVPFQDDIVRVYRSLNVVVHASTEPEPFGRTIVEAMACSRPVLVANAGGAAELFQQGENALGFALGSAGALTQTMAESLELETRIRLGEAARAHAVQSFGRSRLGRQLLQVYCAGRTPPAL